MCNVGRRHNDWFFKDAYRNEDLHDFHQSLKHRTILFRYLFIYHLSTDDGQNNHQLLTHICQDVFSLFILYNNINI